MSLLPLTVVGLDLSLTGTGIATITAGDIGPTFETRTIKSKGKKDDNLKQRRERLRFLQIEIMGATLLADLVVVEGPAFASTTGSMWDRAGLWWLVVNALHVADRPVAVAAPTTVKKFAAGKGNADKSAVSVGMARLWGEGCACANDNEWDALTLATMGAQRLGVPGVPTRAHHAATLEAVAWPQEYATAEAS